MSKHGAGVGEMPIYGQFWHLWHFWQFFCLPLYCLYTPAPVPTGRGSVKICPAFAVDQWRKVLLLPLLSFIRRGQRPFCPFQAYSRRIELAFDCCGGQFCLPL